jgi:hypothetical protein
MARAIIPRFKRAAETRGPTLFECTDLRAVEAIGALEGDSTSGARIIDLRQ